MYIFLLDNFTITYYLSTFLLVSKTIRLLTMSCELNIDVRVFDKGLDITTWNHISKSHDDCMVMNYTWLETIINTPDSLVAWQWNIWHRNLHWMKLTYKWYNNYQKAFDSFSKVRETIKHLRCIWKQKPQVLNNLKDLQHMKTKLYKIPGGYWTQWEVAANSYNCQPNNQRIPVSIETIELHIC